MKKLKIIVEILLIILMFAQILYVFEGNLAHEIMGMTFFALVVVHMIFKRKTIAAMLKKKMKGWMLVSQILVFLTFASIVVLMITSIAVSRTIFPFKGFAGSVSLHTLFATIAVTLAVMHSCMYFIKKGKNKKRAIIVTCILSVVAFSISYFGVPYLNRHFKTVVVKEKKFETKKIVDSKLGKTLTVYFTRVGNTDFEKDVDAVSGASLMLEDGELTGNTQMLSEMVLASMKCDVKAITLTGKKYPSSYNDTVAVAMDEIKNDARPEIEPIDIADYDSVILIYPLWWGTIPAPVATFLEDNNWDNKDLYLLATQGSSGFGSSVKDIKKITSKAKVHEGLSIYCDDIPNCFDKINHWIKGLN